MSDSARGVGGDSRWSARSVMYVVALPTFSSRNYFWGGGGVVRGAGSGGGGVGWGVSCTHARGVWGSHVRARDNQLCPAESCFSFFFTLKPGVECYVRGRPSFRSVSGRLKLLSDVISSIKNLSVWFACGGGQVRTRDN